MILLPHDVFSLFLFPFGALYFGRPFCIDMGCIDIGYCIYDICGLWTVFVVMYFWICIYGYAFMVMCMHVFGYVFLAMCLGMCFWLCVWLSGLDPPRGPV